MTITRGIDALCTKYIDPHGEKENGQPEMRLPHLHDILRDLISDAPPRATLLFIVDGLGSEQLRNFAAAAPFLATSNASRHTRSAGYPSSTPASVMAILSRSPAAHHGIVGCEYRAEPSLDLFNPLLSTRQSAEQHELGVDSFFGSRRYAGEVMQYVIPAQYVLSGFTRLTANGASVQGYASMGELEACLERVSGLVCAYYPDLDKAGHVFGVGSPEWIRALVDVDNLISRIQKRVCASGADVIVVSDHGMINVDMGSSHRFDLRDAPELAAGVHQMGGDARAPFLYCDSGAMHSVRRAWIDRFGSHAVATQSEAVTRGWIPTPSAVAAARYGDLLVSLPPNTVVFDSRQMERPTSNVGFHGARTLEERLVPILHFKGEE